MGDTYIELLVKKPDSKTASLLHNFMIVVGVVFFLASLFFGIYLIIPAILILGLSFIPTLYTDIEYEYLYLDKELTVDRIRKQTSRKTVASYKLDSLELMAPKGSARMERFGQLKTADYSSGSEEGCPYEIVTEGKGEKIRIIIDTNDDLLSAMKKTIPHNIYTD